MRRRLQEQIEQTTQPQQPLLPPQRPQSNPSGDEITKLHSPTENIRMMSGKLDSLFWNFVSLRNVVYKCDEQLSSSARCTKFSITSYMRKFTWKNIMPYTILISLCLSFAVETWGPFTFNALTLFSQLLQRNGSKVSIELPMHLYTFGPPVSYYVLTKTRNWYL